MANPTNVPFPLPDDDRFEADDAFIFDEPNSPLSEDDVSESLSDVGDDSDDVCETPIVNFMNDIGDVCDDDLADFQDNIHIACWKESEKG